MPSSNSLRRITRPRLYEQVISQLREHAAANGLKAGDRLPSERELAERLGVSRASVKQATVVLEVQGLVEIRHGGGVFLLVDELVAEPVAAMVERQQRLVDVLDARDALETKIAELAARRREDTDIAALDEALAVMRADIAAGGIGEEGDRRFHAALTAAARNPLVAAFMNEIKNAITESRRESLHQAGRPAESLAQHERIAAAVVAGDAAGAAAAMKAHLGTVGQVRLLDWNPDAS